MYESNWSSNAKPRMFWSSETGIQYVMYIYMDEYIWNGNITVSHLEIIHSKTLNNSIFFPENFQRHSIRHPGRIRSPRIDPWWRPCGRNPLAPSWGTWRRAAVQRLERQSGWNSTSEADNFLEKTKKSLRNAPIKTGCNFRPWLWNKSSREVLPIWYLPEEPPQASLISGASQPSGWMSRPRVINRPESTIKFNDLHGRYERYGSDKIRSIVKSLLFVTEEMRNKYFNHLNLTTVIFHLSRFCFCSIITQFVLSKDWFCKMKTNHQIKIEQ